MASRAMTERGKTEFDGLRALFDRQNDNLGAARTEGIRELDRMRHWRDGLAIAMVVAFVGDGGRTGAAGAQRGHPPTGRPRRGMPAHHRRQLRRTHRPARATRHPSYRRRRRGHAATDRRRTRGVADGRATRSTSRPRTCGGPTPNSSSSPTSPPTICRSRCARSRPSASCSRSATATSSTSAAPNTSPSRSTAPSGCRR